MQDTSVTLENLEEEGFHPEVIAAVEELTKRNGENRFEAAARAAANPIARVVKLADVTDNMDLGRISDPTEKDFERLEEYAVVRRLLLEHDRIMFGQLHLREVRFLAVCFRSYI